MMAALIFPPIYRKSTVNHFINYLEIKSFLKNDDIVTQMSALGLSKQRDEELTPVLLRKLRVPRYK